MKKLIFKLFLILLSFGFVLNVLPTFTAHAIKNEPSIENQITAKSGLLIDYHSGKVLFEKNANERLPIASMTKLASLAVVFDAIEKGVVKENEYVVVSETAAAVGGSSAFLDAGSSYKVADLIKTIVIASANDSTVALAEHIAGSEELFVSRMNKFARDLHLNDTNFVNSTGLPCENHYSSAFDIANIYKTICNNSIYKKFAKIWMDDFIHPSGRKTGLVNTNRLVKTYDGIEGGKTGYTDLARFCLTASATRGNLRLIGVIIGANDSKTRFSEMSKLFNFGFANFENKCVVNSEIATTVTKFKSAKEPVNIYAERDSYMLFQKGSDEDYSTDYQLNDIKAPLKSGDVVGKLFIFDKNNMVIDEINLIIKNDVGAVGVKESIKKIVEIW